MRVVKLKHNVHKYLAPILLGVFYILLFVILIQTHFIPLRYRLITGATILFIILLILIFTKKPIFRYIMSIVVIGISIFVVNSWGFFDDITASKDYEKIKYQLIAPQIKMKYETVGYYNLKTDHLETLSDSVKTNYEVVNMQEYTSLDTLYSDLANGSIDAILIDDSSYESIAIMYPNFKKMISIKNYTLEIEYELESVNVDVTTTPFIIYLTGIDIYGDVNTRSRSDMNMILVVNPIEKKVLTVAIPRDTYVPLGCEDGSNDKLTHSGIYGIACSVNTVENLFDIQINYYLKVNFTGLVKIIDSIGGVEVYSNYTFETDSGYTFHKGYNTVNGKEALAFARERNHLPQGDVDRSVHHQELMQAIFKKVTSIEELPNLPNQLHNLQNVMDTNFGDENFSKIITTQIEKNDEWIFESMYLKGVGDMQPTYSLDQNYKYYVYWPQQESLTDIKVEINRFLEVPSE